MSYDSKIELGILERLRENWGCISSQDRVEFFKIVRELPEKTLNYIENQISRAREAYLMMQESKENGGLIGSSYHIKTFMTILGPINLSIESKPNSIDDTME